MWIALDRVERGDLGRGVEPLLLPGALHHDRLPAAQVAKEAKVARAEELERAQFNAEGEACRSGSGGVKYCSLFSEDGSRIEGKRKRARRTRPCQRCVIARLLPQATECSGRNWHEAKCQHFDANGDPRVTE